MAAITKRLLHLRPNPHSYHRLNPYPIHHFSSSSDLDPPADNPQSESAPEPDSSSQSQIKPSFFKSFNDVKASLQGEQNRHQTFGKPLSFSGRTARTPPLSKAASDEEIRRNISEFRRRSVPPLPSTSPGQYVSMEQHYNRTVKPNIDNPATQYDSSTAKPFLGPATGGRHSFNAIYETLSCLKPNPNHPGGKLTGTSSRSRSKDVWMQNSDPNANVGSTRIIGGSDIFRLRGKGDSDLGKKLKMLRPEKRKGKWFSLQELSDRLAKLRKKEEEEEEEDKRETKFESPMKGIRRSLSKMDEEKDQKKKGMPLTLEILSQVGGVESYMLSPPQEHLIEKYFHPDNMSSAEKLKLELTKIRDEFKMSESDCGSARVQVAQLTTKIKHLSNVLQKKDKHSRKGLQAMVQKRKKLLRYLRRTDWESYCFVISKLGLRDNPDVKA